MDPLAVAGAITVVLTALGGVGHLVLVIYRWARRMEKALLYVESEMQFNGGKTMRDSMRRIERQLGIDPPEEP